MNRVSYRLKRGQLADFKLECLVRSVCPQLVPASCYIQGEELVVTLETAGLFHAASSLKEGASGEAGQPGLALRLGGLLGWIRRISEACAGLEEYLIQPADCSFDLEDLFLEAGGGPARLILKPSGLSLLGGLETLCCQVQARCPQANGDLLAERLVERWSREQCSYRRLLAWLSTWQSECGR